MHEHKNQLALTGKSPTFLRGSVNHTVEVMQALKWLHHLIRPLQVLVHLLLMRFVDGRYGESNFESLVQFYLNEIRRAQLSAPFSDGFGLVAATLDTEDDQIPLFRPLINV